MRKTLYILKKTLANLKNIIVYIILYSHFTKPKEVIMILSAHYLLYIIMRVSLFPAHYYSNDKCKF